MPKSQEIYAGRSQTMQINSARTAEIIGRAADEMARANRVDKVPLSDLAQVKREAEQYLIECTEKSMLPTVRGIAARLGLSRIALYEYAKSHTGSEFQKWLEDFSDLCGEVSMQAAAEGTINVVAAIFTAKARYGWKETVVLETQPQSALGDTIPAEEIEERYHFLPGE